MLMPKCVWVYVAYLGYIGTKIQWYSLAIAETKLALDLFIEISFWRLKI